MLSTYRYKTHFGKLLIIQIIEQKFHVLIGGISVLTGVLEAVLVRAASQESIEPFSLSAYFTISYQIPQ